eukprot:655310_1
MKSVIRSIKNELNKYSESEQLVRTITSNNDTPPTKLMLAQLAQRLSDHNEFPPIVKMLFLRLQDYNCLFHVEKSLLCVEYLMQSGDNYKKFTRFCAKQQTTFTKLTKYRYQMDGREIGKNVRRRARRILGKLNVARGRAQSEHAIKKRNFEWETFDHIDDAKHKDPPTEQDPFYFMSDNDDFFSQDDLDVANDSNALSFDANNNNHKDISTTQTTDTHEVFIISQLRSFGYKEVDIKHALNNVADKTDINGIIEYIDKRDVFADLTHNMHSQVMDKAKAIDSRADKKAQKIASADNKVKPIDSRPVKDVNSSNENEQDDEKMLLEQKSTVHGSTKQFYNFLKQHRLDQFFDKFKENECADIRDIEYLME